MDKGSVNHNDFLSMLNKVYGWDLFLFIPGEMLFYYLPLDNMLNRLANIITFFFFQKVMFLQGSHNRAFKEEIVWLEAK